jgi:CDGSH-type Zn-finger protein
MEKKMPEATTPLPEVRVTKDGPYLVSGKIPLARATIGTNAEGESVRWDWGARYAIEASYALCHCGHSASKPFCDGSHLKAGFDGTETASRKPYREEAKAIVGPTMSLTDVESLCAFARYCDPNGQVWSLVEETDSAQARRDFVRQTCDCPSGRLVTWDNATGEAIEPEYEPSIGLVEDPTQDCSGPLWLRGGIAAIAADGFRYEIRNRVTLCRCGASSNKPFCDGTHAAIKFKDGL